MTYDRDAIELDPWGYPQILDRQGTPISLRRYGDLVENRSYKRVADDEVGPFWVSTVWLGFNHGYGHSPPLIFETMVFDLEFGWNDLAMERYATEEEAVLGHELMVIKVRAWWEARGLPC